LAWLVSKIVLCSQSSNIKGEGEEEKGEKARDNRFETNGPGMNLLRMGRTEILRLVVSTTVKRGKLMVYVSM